MLGMDDALRHLDQLAKPPGSLGRLEEIAARMCVAQGTLAPVAAPREVILFAGDHGVVEAGVSAWPSDVTRLMMNTIVSGRAVSTVLASLSETPLSLIDVGSLGPTLEPTLGETIGGGPFLAKGVRYRDARFRQGTANLASQPALTASEFQQAFAIGASEGTRCHQAGTKLLVLGEMGIGNTTPAACLTSLLLNLPAETTVGRGAGGGDEQLARKRAVVDIAVKRSQRIMQNNPVEGIVGVAGLEIAAMAGCMSTALKHEITVLLDGYVVTAALLCLRALEPEAFATYQHRVVAAHQSAEPGHRLALKSLSYEPIFADWGMRLGEGSGAILAIPVIEAACGVSGKVASLQDVLVGKIRK